MEKRTKSQIGKASRAAGTRFELKVRKDVESKNWIVSKWMNNIEFGHTNTLDGKFKAVPWKDLTLKNGKHYPNPIGKLIPAKHKFRGPGIPMSIGTGFPDFICIKFTKHFLSDNGRSIELEERWRSKKSEKELGLRRLYEVIGVEAKSNGYLDKEEKEKCKWLLDNHIFSKILIASKGIKRGEIIYKEWGVKK